MFHGFTSYIVQIIPISFSPDSVTTAIYLVSFNLIILSILHQTMACGFIFIITYTLFDWIFYILYNRFSSTINFHLSTQIFQHCKPISDLNTILLITFYLIYILRSNLCDRCLFTVSLSLSQSDALRDWTSSILECLCLSEYGQIWLWVSLSGDVQVYLSIMMWEYCTFYWEIFRCGKVYYSEFHY
jgi:hypothetical protein